MRVTRSPYEILTVCRLPRYLLSLPLLLLLALLGFGNGVLLVDSGDVVQDFKRVQVALTDKGKPFLLEIRAIVLDICKYNNFALFW